MSRPPGPPTNQVLLLRPTKSRSSGPPKDPLLGHKRSRHAGGPAETPAETRLAPTTANPPLLETHEERHRLKTKNRHFPIGYPLVSAFGRKISCPRECSTRRCRLCNSGNLQPRNMGEVRQPQVSDQKKRSLCQLHLPVLRAQVTFGKPTGLAEILPSPSLRGRSRYSGHEPRSNTK